MTVAAIDKKISDYIPQLNISQKEAVLSVMQAFVGGKEDSEAKFRKEMNRELDEMESGKVKMYSWDEVVNDARAAYKALKAK